MKKARALAAGFGLEDSRRRKEREKGEKDECGLASSYRHLRVKVGRLRKNLSRTTHFLCGSGSKRAMADNKNILPFGVD